MMEIKNGKELNGLSKVRLWGRVPPDLGVQRLGLSENLGLQIEREDENRLNCRTFLFGFHRILKREGKRSRHFSF